jgi:hypothetical protein
MTGGSTLVTRPGHRNPSYLLKSGSPTNEYEIFISSGSDLNTARDQLEELVRVFNDQALSMLGPAIEWSAAVGKPQLGGRPLTTETQSSDSMPAQLMLSLFIT